MCLTGWARERVLDTGGANYPPIMHRWQCVCETERRKDGDRHRELEAQSLIACLRSPGFLMAWCDTLNDAQEDPQRWLRAPWPSHLTYAACFTPRLSSCMRSHTSSGTYVQPRAPIYLRRCESLRRVDLFPFLADAWNSVAPWLYVLNMNTVKQVNNIRGISDRCSVGGN